MIGCGQTTVTQLWSDVIVNKAEQILRDPTTPFIGGSHSAMWPQGAAAGQ